MVGVVIGEAAGAEAAWQGSGGEVALRDAPVRRARAPTTARGDRLLELATDSAPGTPYLLKEEIAGALLRSSWKRP